MKIRHIGLLLFLTSLLFFPMGCMSQRGQQTATGRIELEFWTLQLNSFADYINGMIAVYEKEHPGVKIKWVDVPFSEGEKRALTSMLSKETPDVINLNPDFSSVLASRNALLDLNQWVLPEQKDKYLPVTWEASSLGGKTFGLPWYITSAVTLYNKTLIEEAGFTKPPQSYAELKQLAKALKSKNLGYCLMPVLAERGRFFKVLKKAGIPLWSDERQSLVFADNQADEVMQYWVSLFKGGYLPPESLTEGHRAAVDRYQSGSLAMLLTGPNFLNIVKENAPGVFQQTRVNAQFPSKSDYVDFSTMVLVVPQQSQHPKEAVDFALFVTNEANTLKLTQLAPVLSPHQHVLESPWFNPKQPKDVLEEGRKISAQQLLSAQTALELHPLQNRLNQIMDFYVQKALLGKLTPKKAMVEAQREMNNLIQ